MSRAATLAQLEAIEATLRAATAQVAALAVSIEEEPDHDDIEDAPCPRCGKRDMAPAGETQDGAPLGVCGGCGANVAAGKVIGG